MKEGTDYKIETTKDNDGNFIKSKVVMLDKKTQKEDKQEKE